MTCWYWICFHWFSEREICNIRSGIAFWNSHDRLFVVAPNVHKKNDNDKKTRMRVYIHCGVWIENSLTARDMQPQRCVYTYIHSYIHIYIYTVVSLNTGPKSKWPCEQRGNSLAFHILLYVTLQTDFVCATGKIKSYYGSLDNNLMLCKAIIG